MPKQQSLPRGLRNNNPLNIRRNPANHWQGTRPTITDKSFEEFTDIIYGFRAAIKIIHNWMKKTRLKSMTPGQIITRWAPPTENVTSSYITTACELAYLRENDRIMFNEKNKLCRLVWAMAVVENGKQYQENLKFHYIEIAYEYVKQNRPVNWHLPDTDANSL